MTGREPVAGYTIGAGLLTSDDRGGNETGLLWSAACGVPIVAQASLPVVTRAAPPNPCLIAPLAKVSGAIR